MENQEEFVKIDTLRGLDISATLRTVCVRGKLSVIIPYQTHTCCIYDKGTKPADWQPPCQACYIKDQYKTIKNLSYTAWKGWLVKDKEILSSVLR